MKLLTPDIHLVSPVVERHERFSSPREPKFRARQRAAAHDGGHIGIGATGRSVDPTLTLPLHPPGPTMLHVGTLEGYQNRLL